MSTKGNSNSALTTTEQREIEFYGDRVVAVRVEDGTVLVPLRPICDLIGVAWQPQARKLQNDPVLSEASAPVTIRLQVPDERGSIASKMICLPLDYLNGWLFGINANRVKTEIRDVLIRYQRECYKVLADAFLEDRVTARPDDELMSSQSPAAVAYRNALAIANMARQQFYIEQRLNSAETEIASQETRIRVLEARLSDPDRLLTTDQARRVADAVQSVAFELGKRSGRNEYAGVYNELYRRFEVPDYRSLPAAKFEECLSWLRQWYGTLTGNDVPF